MSAVAAPPQPGISKQRFGLALGGFLNLASIPSVFFPTPEGEVGPPLGILIASAVLGVVGVVAAVVAWRTGRRAAIRVLAGTLILQVIGALPAFFVDGLETWIRLLAGISVLLSVLAVVLMFSSAAAHAVSFSDGEVRS